MTPVSSIALEDALKQRTAAARASKPVPTKTTKVEPGRKRITGPRKPGTTKVEQAIKQRDTATAKKLLASATKKPKKSLRAAGFKPSAKDLDDLGKREAASYSAKVLAIACPRCGAPKNAPCYSSTPRKTEIRSAHRQRVEAVKK
jgi:hypothetical protein